MEMLSLLVALCDGNSPVNYPKKGHLCGALIFSLVLARASFEQTVDLSVI